MKKLSRDKLIFLIIGALFVIACILIGIRVTLDRPKDLGVELKYIGKQHVGCPLPLPLGYLMLCSSEPGERYYFATDLDVQQIGGYFNATLTPHDNLPDGSGAITSKAGQQLDYTFKYLGFQNPDGKRFTVTYYDNKEAIIALGGLRDSSKASIISLSREDYSTARSVVQE